MIICTHMYITSDIGTCHCNLPLMLLVALFNISNYMYFLFVTKCKRFKTVKLPTYTWQFVVTLIYWQTTYN